MQRVTNRPGLIGRPIAKDGAENDGDCDVEMAMLPVTR